MDTNGFKLTGRLLLGLSSILVSGQFPAWSQTAPSPQVQSPGTELSTNAEAADTHERAFRRHVSELFRQGQYAELEALAYRLQSQQLRFRGGAWQLNEFYGLISYPGSLTATDAEWQARIAKLGEWAKAYPASPTPRVAMAQAYLYFAWKARGNGMGDTVTAVGGAQFDERAESARKILESAAKLSVHCPAWYVVMGTVALAQGWPRAQVDKLVEAALTNAPGYYYFATGHANYLLPKWYGKPGETEEFAEQAANRTGGDEGNIEYFMIAARINCCGKTQAPGLAWPRVQQGFAALDRHYGTTNHEHNMMAYLALRAGDKETAQQLFARIGDNWDESVWRSKARFDASRTGQVVGRTKPVGVYTPSAGSSEADK